MYTTIAFNLPFSLFLLLLIATFWLYIYAILVNLNAYNILLLQGEQERSYAFKIYYEIIGILY